MQSLLKTSSAFSNAASNSIRPRIDCGTHDFHRHFAPFFLNDAAQTTQTFHVPSGNPGLQNAPNRIVQRVQIGRHRRPFVGRYEIGQFAPAPLLTTFRPMRRRVVLLKNESLSLKHRHTMVFHYRTENPRFVVFCGDSLVRFDEMKRKFDFRDSALKTITAGLF